jgi:hypothetical protein
VCVYICVRVCVKKERERKRFPIEITNFSSIQLIFNTSLSVTGKRLMYNCYLSAPPSSLARKLGDPVFCRLWHKTALLHGTSNFCFVSVFMCVYVCVYGHNQCFCGEFWRLVRHKICLTVVPSR